jgi:hypothetical protein
VLPIAPSMLTDRDLVAMLEMLCRYCLRDSEAD